MTLYLKRTLDDGATVVADNTDGTEFVLRPGQWDSVRALPYEQQRMAVERCVIANRADPSGGRSQLDEQTMDQARNSSSGEAHQDQSER
jgi:hypothetical protein